ncbi:hypothetical protein L249_3928 [Ophiocordyceps polyrhachis-furcata BCC 54312]|uniref:Uncharacterized protein n=1 Tax=Ophiocordyceps polyrhachis-furcata BCC 54312 TaxID=1330021 RepID=A0A367L547_9HYPO|nr:hypothetical protein L249_3928 [Ophiocordyceps polyrhachis-furcata BCC 54312]
MRTPLLDPFSPDRRPRVLARYDISDHLLHKSNLGLVAGVTVIGLGAVFGTGIVIVGLVVRGVSVLPLSRSCVFFRIVIVRLEQSRQISMTLEVTTSMISRVFLSSSICLQCRLGLTLRRGAQPTDNILLSRASRPLRFASGSAALTKESFQARFSGSRKRPQEKKSDVRSQESIEALLSGADELKTTRSTQSAKRKTRTRTEPKHHVNDNELPEAWAKSSKQATPTPRAKVTESGQTTSGKQSRIRSQEHSKTTSTQSVKRKTRTTKKPEYDANYNELSEAWTKSSQQANSPPRVKVTESGQTTSGKQSGIRSRESVEAFSSGAADSKSTTQQLGEQKLNNEAKPAEGAYNDELYKEYIDNLKATLPPSVPDDTIDPLTGRMLELPMQPQPFEVRTNARHVAKILAVWEESKNALPSPKAAHNGFDASSTEKASSLAGNVEQAFRFDLSEDEEAQKEEEDELPEKWINASKQAAASPEAVNEGRDTWSTKEDLPSSSDSARKSQVNEARRVNDNGILKTWIDYPKRATSSPEAAIKGLDTSPRRNPTSTPNDAEEFRFRSSEDDEASRGAEEELPKSLTNSKQATSSPDAANESIIDTWIGNLPSPPQQFELRLGEKDEEAQSMDEDTLPEAWIRPLKEAAGSGLDTGAEQPPSTSPSAEQQHQTLDAARDEADESRAKSEDFARPDNPRVQRQGASQPSENHKPRPRQFQPRRGTFFRHEDLGHVSLGEPATALLTTDPDVSRGRRRPEPQLTLIDEAESTGLPMHCQNIFEQEQEQESEAEAMKRLRQIIDDLRPKDTTALRERGVTRLAKKLTDGFTSQQLMAYYKDDAAAHGLRMHSSLPSYPWIVQHQPWQAMRSMTLGQLKPKMRHAIRIITETWKLDVEEQVEGQGTMMIKLKPDVFKLIAQPSSRLLQGLGDMYFDSSNHERISHYPDTHQLSIHCRRSTAFTILARMDEMLESTTTKRVSVKDVDEDNLTEEALDELGRITNTLLQYHGKDSELSISWIPEVTTAADDAADSHVLRLLSTWQPPASVNKVQILTGQSDEKDLTFVTHHRASRTLSWRDKLREWSRCVSPIPISDGKKKTVTAPLLSERVSFPKTKVKVDDETTTYHLSATFGHILHLRPHVRTAKTVDSHRALSPLVPHPASLTSLTADGADDEVIVDRSTAVILHFVPDPTAISSDQVRLPPPRIRLRLPVKDDADFSISSFPAEDSSLEAVIPSVTHDVLLPAESVDVRLKQEQTMTLDANQKPIQDFLAQSNLNLLLLQGHRVKTPNRITLSLPAKLLLPPPSTTTINKSKERKKKKKKQGRKAKSDPSPSPSTTETIQIPFLYKGLELHQTIETAHKDRDDLRIRYSTIQAGHQGGQRQELSLHAPPSRLPPLQQDEDVATSFLDAVHGVAVGHLFPWHDGHRLMQRKTGERFKEHMLDQPLDYDRVAGDDLWKDSDPPGFSSSSSSFSSSPSSSISSSPRPRRSSRPPRLYTSNQPTTSSAPPS